MNKTFRNQKISKILEKLKWLFISILFILSFFMYYYFYQMKLFVQILILSFFMICLLGTLICTKKAKDILSYINMSKKEMQKMTWPKYKETFHTTLIVISVTILISLLLWGLDSIIFHLIAFIISLRF